MGRIQVARGQRVKLGRHRNEDAVTDLGELFNAPPVDDPMPIRRQAATHPEHKAYGTLLTAAVRALCPLIIVLAVLSSVSAQDAPADKVAGGTCSFEGNKAFARRPSPALEITAKFIAKPDTNADVRQMRMHFIFSRILGRYASTQIYSSSLRRCSFTAELAASFDLHFELNSIGSTVHDECSLTRCAQWLSDLLESLVTDQTAFKNAADGIVKTYRSFDTAHLKNLRHLGMIRAAQESYRHIYRPGTQERIFVDLSAEDFVDLGFEEFDAWFRSQQRALRAAGDRADVPRQPSPGASVSNGQTEDVHCAINRSISVEELNIDHHGWGQQSIILINHGFKKYGLSGISNATLRALCPPHEKNSDGLDGQPWREMAGRISCSRDGLNRDRWLILFSNEEPVATSAEMRRYAVAIAQALKADQCVHPELRILLANFSQPR
jgi:hypothetical protein